MECGAGRGTGRDRVSILHPDGHPGDTPQNSFLALYSPAPKACLFLPGIDSAPMR